MPSPKKRPGLRVLLGLLNHLHQFFDDRITVISNLLVRACLAGACLFAELLKLVICTRTIVRLRSRTSFGGGLCSCGLYSYGLCSYGSGLGNGPYSYGLYSHGSVLTQASTEAYIVMVYIVLVYIIMAQFSHKLRQRPT